MLRVPWVSVRTKPKSRSSLVGRQPDPGARATHTVVICLLSYPCVRSKIFGGGSRNVAVVNPPPTVPTAGSNEQTVAPLLLIPQSRVRHVVAPPVDNPKVRRNVVVAEPVGAQNPLALSM